MLSRVGVLLGVWAVAVGVRTQTPPAPEPPMRSTTTGVYAPAQADAGQAIFESTCLGGCHNLASHKGMAFKLRWEGRPLSELFDIINDEMPKDDPGSLTPENAAALVAYLLKLNGLQAGKEPLPSDSAALRKIKIELPAGGAARAPNR